MFTWQLTFTWQLVKAGRVFRTSCVGTASDNDSCVIVENIKPSLISVGRGVPNGLGKV